jgi:predicted nucleotidyltransferase
MINFEEKYLSEVRNILARHLDKNAEVYVFGSRVDGKHQQYSDLDLAVHAGGVKVSSQALTAIKTDFDNSLIPVKVDLVDINDISEEFKTIILKKFERLYF